MESSSEAYWLEKTGTVVCPIDLLVRDGLDWNSGLCNVAIFKGKIIQQVVCARVA